MFLNIKAEGRFPCDKPNEKVDYAGVATLYDRGRAVYFFFFVSLASFSLIKVSSFSGFMGTS